MTQDERKRQAKYPKVHKHFVKEVLETPEFVPNWNYQPRIPHNDKPLKRIIRNQIKPFVPATDIPAVVDNPAANLRKVIDFAVASLAESDKRWHCEVQHEMLNRLAYCWNVANHITPAELRFMYDYFQWTCPKTGTKHSIRTPLSIEFKTHIWQGGVMKIANVRPIYNGNLPGEFHWIGKPDYLQVIAA